MHAARQWSEDSDRSSQIVVYKMFTAAISCRVMHINDAKRQRRHFEMRQKVTGVK
jgi:hypothetical protein